MYVVVVKEMKWSKIRSRIKIMKEKKNESMKKKEKGIQDAIKDNYKW